MKRKEETERTALTWKRNVLRLKKRGGVLKNNLKGKRIRFGQIGFPPRYRVSRKSGKNRTQSV